MATGDIFNRHTPLRRAGFKLQKKLTEDCGIILQYIRPEFAALYIGLMLDQYPLPLFGINMSFCINCGRFLRLGSHFNLCWICESDLEEEIDE